LFSLQADAVCRHVSMVIDDNDAREPMVLDSDHRNRVDSKDDCQKHSFLTSWPWMPTEYSCNLHDDLREDRSIQTNQNDRTLVIAMYRISQPQVQMSKDDNNDTFDHRMSNGNDTYLRWPIIFHFQIIFLFWLDFG
jgi:hypothetical protein